MTTSAAISTAVSVTSSAAPTAADTLQAIRAERERIAELGARAEEERRLPTELVDLLTNELNLFNIFVPQRLGGLELDAIGGMDVIEELSSIDPAAGWCLLKGSSSNMLAAMWPEDVAAELLGSRRDVIAGSLNPRGRAVKQGDGWLVSGSWDWGTATSFSTTIMGGAMLFESDGTTPISGPFGPASRLMLFRSSDVTIEDTWDTYGMRGTASADFSVTDLFVPDRMAINMMGPPGQMPMEPLFRVPTPMWMAAPHAAVSIGIARGCLDAVVELSKAKTPLASKTLLKDKEWVRDSIGRAHALISSSRAYVYSACSALWASPMPSPQLALDVHLAAVHAAHASVEAVDLLNRCAGGTSVYRRSPIQRYFRDAHVASTHFLVNVEKFAAGGRVLVGDAMGIMQP
jgi:indole-3-acetate monooxygenase